MLTIGVGGKAGDAAEPEFGEAVRPPTAPKSLTLTPGNGQITATWEPPEDLGHPPITGYIVSYRLDGTPTWQQFHQSATSKTFTGLTNGSLYHVRVWVSNITGTGAFIEAAVRPSAEGGESVTVDTPDLPKPPPDPGPVRLPGAPSNLVLTPGDGEITATWEAPEDLGNPKLSHYRVEHRATRTSVFNGRPLVRRRCDRDAP